MLEPLQYHDGRRKVIWPLQRRACVYKPSRTAKLVKLLLKLLGREVGIPADNLVLPYVGLHTSRCAAAK